MADEAQYSSGPDTGSNKRAPTTRRVTGFSAPIIASSSPDSVPTSYSSVPPPVEDIQLAKQRAREIAARLFNNASSGAAAAAGLDTKRPRVENGGGFDSSDKGFSSIPTDPNCPTREVEIMGTPDQIAKAEHLINEVLAEAESGGPAIVSRRSTGQAGSEQFVMKIPNNKVGLVIGKRGETIKNMQASTAARIQVIPLHLPPGDTSTERTVQIDGTSEQIEAAKQLVNEVISEILIDKMGKKSKSKTPREVEENTVGEKSAVEEGKPSSCANKPAASVIDEIFARKKRKKTEAEKANKQNEEPNKPKRKKKDLGFEDGAFVDQTSRSKKRTNDGLAIYTEEELGMNKADAGSTPLCPFDCSCCF